LSLIDAATGRQRHTFGDYRSSLSRVLFDTGGGLVYTASYDKSVRVFDLQRGKMLASAEGDGPVLWITQPPDRSVVLATFPAGTINAWKFGKGADGSSDLHLAATAPLHQRWLSKAKYSPSGEFLATVGRDRLLNVWDRRFGLVAQFAGHATGVVALDISPDGRTIVTGDEDGVIRVWNAPSKAGERANGASISHHTVDELCRNLPLGRRTLLMQAVGQAKLRPGMAAPEEITASNIVKESETDPCHRRSAGMMSWALGGWSGTSDRRPDLDP
jgi:WD40 repeat protein